MTALDTLWAQACSDLHPRATIFRVHLTLVDLTRANSQQIDLLHDDDKERKKWEKITGAIVSLNSRYSKTTVSLGMWKPPKGGNVGGKISYTRISTADDFW